ncbi:mitochondrial zinc maintenance protein 1, mitochondrial [Zopfia rhizophila CBS 207.26]|uniref:Mitochondrial zinc maintenance protein 1, mitochondrial n=1 Tax=Zopfia rhizophila CBS 207.26 TaxID=1314779 RepID=A0A6A6EKZ9_9PEZI|nr:mitochondrial zinc maintenance protein 1, mitochondrial [Zopfia rhizophila CBS 207.26]
MSQEMALAAYRHLLRSTRIAFQGDVNMLIAARYKARKNFEDNRGLPSGSEGVSKQITHAEEVAKFLRENVVQGQAVDNDPGSYKLRIHEHTERGNNEDIKKGKGNTLTGTKCCSS